MLIIRQWLTGRAGFQADWHKPWWCDQLERVPEGETMMMIIMTTMMIIIIIIMIIMTTMMMMIIIIIIVLNVMIVIHNRLHCWYQMYIFAFSPRRLWTMVKKGGSSRRWTRWVKKKFIQIILKALNNSLICLLHLLQTCKAQKMWYLQIFEKFAISENVERAEIIAALKPLRLSKPQWYAGHRALWTFRGCS